MNKKIIRFLATFIFSTVPFLLYAEQVETKISADTIIVERGEVLRAEGNVLVQHGSSKIKAKAIIFDKKTDKIRFTGLQDFQDGKAINLSAADAVISSDLSEGIIRSANLLLDESVKVRTD